MFTPQRALVRPRAISTHSGEALPLEELVLAFLEQRRRRTGTIDGTLIQIAGGPGAGKTAVLELAKRDLGRHVQILPEAASIVFGGGFPRLKDDVARRSAQRAIYHVQNELEVIGTLGGVELALSEAGVPIELGSGVAAAQREDERPAGRLLIRLVGAAAGARACAGSPPADAKLRGSAGAAVVNSQ